MNEHTLQARLPCQLDAAERVPAVGVEVVGRREADGGRLVGRTEGSVGLVAHLGFGGHGNELVVTLQREGQLVGDDIGIAHTEVEDALLVGLADAADLRQLTQAFFRGGAVRDRL